MHPLEKEHFNARRPPTPCRPNCALQRLPSEIMTTRLRGTLAEAVAWESACADILLSEGFCPSCGVLLCICAGFGPLIDSWMYPGFLAGIESTDCVL